MLFACPESVDLFTDFRIQYRWMEQQFFFTAILAVKLSIVMFFYSLRPPPALRIAALVAGRVTVLFCLVCILFQIFQCRPVAYFWNRFKPNSSCSCLSLETSFAFLETMNAIEIATDIVLAVLPCAMAWNMKMKRSKKIAVAIMLGLGSL